MILFICKYQLPVALIIQFWKKGVVITMLQMYIAYQKIARYPLTNQHWILRVSLHTNTTQLHLLSYIHACTSDTCSLQSAHLQDIIPSLAGIISYMAKVGIISCRCARECVCATINMFCTQAIIILKVKLIVTHSVLTN